ncbi:MAG: aldehyde dehydrogenase family protein [Myxococcota bacterium]
MDTDKLDQKLERLDAKKQEWADLAIEDKIAMARRLKERTVEVGEGQVQEALEAKGIPVDSPHVGEEWLGGVMATVRNLRLLIGTLEDIRRHGEPDIDKSDVRERSNGKIAVDVFPKSIWDKLMYTGFTAEVYQQEGVTRDNLYEHMASFYLQEDPVGKVSLVLGAGNVNSIPPLDCIYKLFAEGEVCILKLNPVNDYIGPYIEESFREFIDAGYMEVVYGGVNVGEYLVHHDLVDTIHITGSDKSHDAIVYGTGEEGDRRKDEDDPVIDKTITSELGNVSPVIVFPGNWTDKELDFQAQNIASQLVNNAGFNCNAVRVVITWEDWPQRDDLMDRVVKILEEVGPRAAYYPGARDRYEAFIDQHDERTDQAGEHREEHLPYAVIRDVDSSHEDDICFQREAWCTVMSETALPGSDPAEYLQKAVEFANDVLWGTLSASIYIDPRSQKEYEDEIEQAIEDLEYGSVVINHWPALAYALGSTTWGAYPGHTRQDIQSGIGVVHNTFLFDKPEKSVIRGPFVVMPKPPWFATNKKTHEIAPRLVDFEEDPSVLKFVKILWPALRG